MIAAVVLILVVGLMVAGLGQMVASDEGSGGPAVSSQAERVAFAGLERGTLALREGTAANFATACTNVAASNVAVSNGSFTLTATRTNPATTLAVAAAATDTTIQLTSAVGFAPRGTAFIDSERINYTGVSVNNLTGVTRGVAGTLAKAHSTGGTGTVVQDQCRITSVGSSGGAVRQLEATIINGHWTEYVDGVSTAVAAAATTLATINTRMPAGDNLIIAAVTFNKASAGNITFAAGAPPAGNIKLLANGVAIDSNRLALLVGGAAGSATLRPEKTFFFVYKDTGAAANTAYSITAQGSAVGVNAEARMLVINGPAGGTSFSYYGASNATVAVGAGATTLLPANVTATNARAEDVILVIGVAHFRNNVAAARNLPATTGVLLRRISTAATLTSNQYAVSFGNTGNPTGDYSVMLVALDTAPGGTNPTYDIAATASAITSIQADGSLLLIRGVGSVFTDGASTALAATPATTTLATQATTAGTPNSAFPGLLSGASNLVVAAIQYIQTTAAARTTAIGQEKILYNAVSQTSNPFASTYCSTGTSVACGHFASALLWRQSSAPATPSFTVETVSSGAGTTAEAKVAVINLDPVGTLQEIYP